MQARIIRQFNDAIDTTIRAIEPLLAPLEEAGRMLAAALLDEKKVICCGNGPSANTVRQLCTYLIDQFRHERPGLPVMALDADSAVLSAIASDYHFHDIFSRQLRALGQPGDVLLAASHRPHAGNLAAAIRAAHDRGMRVILLAGAESPDLVTLLAGDDILLAVPADSRERIQEVHLMIIHCLCDLIEHQLFGHDGNAGQPETAI